MEKVLLSLVVPFYNEEKVIRKIAKVLSSYLDRHFPNKYELIFVNDGSRDNSLKFLKEEIDKYSKARLISYSKNRGRGYAVRRGFRSAQGEMIGFIDADLEIPPFYILPCCKRLSDFDIAIVSKHLGKSKVRTTVIRKVSSTLFNKWTSLVLGTGLKDHMGGLKVAKKKVIKKILGKTKSNGWLFDSEFLFFAKRQGFKTCEIPVKITYGFQRFRMSLAVDFLKSFYWVLKLRFDNL